MKILKKLKFHDYEVLDHGQMREVRGGTDSELRDKACDSSADESKCGGKCRQDGIKGHCYYGQPIANDTYTAPYNLCYCEKV